MLIPNMRLSSIVSACILAAGACYAQGTATAQPATAKPDNSAAKALVDEASAHVKHISAEEMRALIGSHAEYTLVDVREPDEWARGHAAGAVNIPRGVLEWRLEPRVPRKDAKIIVYCRLGWRSVLAAESLQKIGYTNVYSFDGGFEAWTAAELPVEKPQTP